jgi:hypothetical protein
MVTIAQSRRRPKPARKSQPGEQYHLKAICRALDVLECFSDERAELNLKDIAALIKHPESSLFRILMTLENRGYLIQNGDGPRQLKTQPWEWRSCRSVE